MNELTISELRGFDDEFPFDLSLSTSIRMDERAFEEFQEGLGYSLDEADRFLMAAEPLSSWKDAYLITLVRRPDSSSRSRLTLQVATDVEIESDESDPPLSPTSDALIAALPESVSRTRRFDFHGQARLNVPANRYVPVFGLPLELFRGKSGPLGRMTGARFELRARGFRRARMALDVSPEGHVNIQVDFDTSQSLGDDPLKHTWDRLLRIFDQTVLKTEEDTDDVDA